MNTKEKSELAKILKSLNLIVKEFKNHSYHLYSVHFNHDENRFEIKFRSLFLGRFEYVLVYAVLKDNGLLLTGYSYGYPYAR